MLDGARPVSLNDVVVGAAPDRKAGARVELATYLLGAPGKRTLESFAASVEAFIARAETERAQYSGQDQSHAAAEDADDRELRAAGEQQE